MIALMDVPIDCDGVPDTYDHCPNQAGPASNNGCPLPENCLCKDDPDVKKLLSDLGLQESLIQQTEKLIEEKNKEYTAQLAKADEAWEKIKKEYEVWKWDAWDTSETIGSAIPGILLKYKGEAVGVVVGVSVGWAAVLSLIAGKCGKIYIKCGYGYTILYKLGSINNIIEHQLIILEWRETMKKEIENDIRLRCSCALR